jgi:hypothetical protein
MKSKKYNTVRTVSKSNQKLVETDTGTLTHIYMTSHSPVLVQTVHIYMTPHSPVLVQTVHIYMTSHSPVLVQKF